MGVLIEILKLKYSGDSFQDSYACHVDCIVVITRADVKGITSIAPFVRHRLFNVVSNAAMEVIRHSWVACVYADRVAFVVSGNYSMSNPLHCCPFWKLVRVTV